MSIVEALARGLPLSKTELKLLILTAPNRYKVHEIEKRNGRGKRTIAQPTAEVKLAQRTLQVALKGMLPIHECAKAYQPETGIYDHAYPHAKSSYLLKVDFKDFFPSIKGGDFKLHLAKYANIQGESSEVCERIFFWRPKRSESLVLAIGAPSSPWLSNTVMYDFDCALSSYCVERGLVYTRYADDLALSTNTPRLLEDAYGYVNELCARLNYPSLKVNPQKTVFTSRRFNRTLTGLVLSSQGEVSVGRARKREIRAMAFRYSSGLLNAEEVSRLKGLLAFMKSIDAKFLMSISRMLGEEKFGELAKWGQKTP